MKGIKLMLGVFAALLLLSPNASAQNKDSDGNVIRGPYETNRIFDNSSIVVGAGLNMTLMHPTSPKSWGNLGLAMDINFNKWWTPYVGGRLGWHGLWNSSKQVFDESNIAADTPYGFNYFHGDILWNVFNTFGGYKADRFWDLNPYIGMGMLDVTDKRNILSKNASHNREYALGVGLQNVLKVTEAINFVIDLQALVSPASKYSTTGGRILFFPSATFGLAFNIGKTCFYRHSERVPAILPVPFTEGEYKALENKLAALQKENKSLKDRIAALQEDIDQYKKLLCDGNTYIYENGQFTPVEAKAGAPVAVYFDCGSASISEREKAHLEYFAEQLVNADTKLLVKGYADKQTGSAKRNQQLSEQRVKAVVDLLKKAGANEANIEANALGATVQPFDGAVKNRVVTVEVQ